MRTISKDNIPPGYQKWIDSKKNSLSVEAFEKMPPTTKTKLKSSLLKEQGFICCFCGQRIASENAEIAHFSPQLLAKNSQQFVLLIDYQNLFASCNGGTSDVEYQVRIKQTAGEIAKLHGESVIYDTNGVQLDENIELHSGQKIVVRKKQSSKTNYHCNAQQGNQKLSFNFINGSLEHDIFFSQDGTIHAKSPQTDSDLNDILNLNSTYFKIKRRNIVSLIIPILIQQTQEQNEDFYNLYSQTDSEGKLEVFAFVYTSITKNYF